MGVLTEIYNQHIYLPRYKGTSTTIPSDLRPQEHSESGLNPVLSKKKKTIENLQPNVAWAIENTNRNLNKSCLTSPGWQQTSTVGKAIYLEERNNNRQFTT